MNHFDFISKTMLYVQLTHLCVIILFPDLDKIAVSQLVRTSLLEKFVIVPFQSLVEWFTPRSVHWSLLWNIQHLSIHYLYHSMSWELILMQ